MTAGTLTMMKVGYQGEPGAFSEEAVGALFPDAHAAPSRTVRGVFEALERGDVAYAVVPLENSLAGSINETYDLLARGGAHIVGEVVLAVDHALLALPGTKLEDIRIVSSHPQALAQCDEYLAELDVELVPVYDTAGAAKRIAEERFVGEAAVASERAAVVYGLEVLARSIQTSEENQTRFAAISPAADPLAEPDKTSLILVTGHKPGALYHCLRPLAEHGVNLTKLESRPVGHTPWRYRFFRDVEGTPADEMFAKALQELREEAAEVQILGSYHRWRTDSDPEAS
ncbi:MAG: prephenate dehydratase [Actinomycetota bacterium]